MNSRFGSDVVRPLPKLESTCQRSYRVVVGGELLRVGVSRAWVGGARKELLWNVLVFHPKESRLPNQVLIRIGYQLLPFWVLKIHGDGLTPCGRLFTVLTQVSEIQIIHLAN